MATAQSSADITTGTTQTSATLEPREYIVFALESVDSNDGISIIGRAKGRNADEAEDKIVDALPLDEQGGPFVTIAARYWTPVEYGITTETKTVRKRK